MPHHEPHADDAPFVPFPPPDPIQQALAAHPPPRGAAFPVHVEEHVLVTTILRAIAGQDCAADAVAPLVAAGLVVPTDTPDVYRVAEGVLARLSIAGAHVLARQVLRPDVAADLGCCRVATRRGRVLRGKTQRLADGALRVEHRASLLQTRVVHVQRDTWATCDELPTDELLAELRAELRAEQESAATEPAPGCGLSMADAISQDHQAAATAAAIIAKGA